MNEYGSYPPPPPQSDHTRVVSSGAWISAAIAMGGLAWADLHMPRWCGFALNWAVILGTCYAITVYKRRWYGWLAFWGLVAAFVIAGILGAFGLMGGNWPSMASLVIGGVVSGIYYWLVRMPRWRPGQRSEVHVIHHVIHHDPETVTAAAARVQFPGPVQKVISGRVVRAISAPHHKISDVLAAGQGKTAQGARSRAR